METVEIESPKVLLLKRLESDLSHWKRKHYCLVNDVFDLKAFIKEEDGTFDLIIYDEITGHEARGEFTSYASVSYFIGKYTGESIDTTNKSTAYKPHELKSEYWRHFKSLFGGDKKNMELLVKLFEIEHNEPHATRYEAMAKVARSMSKVDYYLVAKFFTRYVTIDYVYNTAKSFDYVIGDMLWKRNR